MTLAYRSDIDGLRALAIVPVVLFHAQVAGFGGGFVGVDVFFVISGFLITGLIQGEVERNEFSYLNFWERRARRLLPPIIVVGAAVFIAGWFLYLPNELKSLGQSLVAMTAFAANIYFWLTSGYFAAPSESMPLLHTWSLAVEEQYYFLFPTVLMLLAGATRKVRTGMVLAIGVASLLFSLVAVERAPEAGYYLLPSRAWELMLGGLLALGVGGRLPLTARRADVMMIVGIVLVAVPIALYDKQTSFPGLAAVPPCLGTALIIVAGTQQDGVVRSLFANRVSVFVGKLSYSLYLWHWPVIVFWQSWVQRPIATFEAGEILVICVVSVVLAWLSYVLVENPIRKRRWLASRGAIFAGTLGALFVLAVVGFATHKTGGWPNRLPPEAAQTLAVVGDWHERQLACGAKTPADVAGNGLCHLGAELNDDAADKFLLWGDSHARAVHMAFHEAAGDLGLAGTHASMDACPPLLGIRLKGQSFTNECPNFNAEVMKRIEAKEYDVVVLAARWSGYGQTADVNLVHEDGLHEQMAQQDLFVRQLEETVRRINQAGVRAVVLEEVPYPPWFRPELVAQNVWRGDEPPAYGIALADYHARNTLAVSVFDRLRVASRIQPWREMCRGEGDFCPAVEGNLPLYRDSNHITNFASKRLLDSIAQQLVGE